LLKILTDGRPKKLKFEGVIIGMPNGLVSILNVRQPQVLKWAAIILSIFLFCSSFAVAAWIFDRVIGDWSRIWILLLPLAAIFIPAIILAIISSTLWPDNSPRFGESLKSPSWYRRARHMRFSEGLAHADSIDELEPDDLRDEAESC